MTITRPFLLMILHFSQIFLTEGLTFTLCYLSFHSYDLYSFGSPGDASFGEVINRNLNVDFIAYQNLDTVKSEPAGYTCGHYMTVCQPYSEGRVGQGLYDLTVKFDNIVFWQNRSSLFVTMIIYETYISVFRSMKADNCASSALILPFTIYSSGILSSDIRRCRIFLRLGCLTVRLFRRRQGRLSCPAARL